MLQSTLCYLERGDAYLMLHRVKTQFIRKLFNAYRFGPPVSVT